MQLRNVITKETYPGHLVGKDESGQELYLQVDGYQPVGLYETTEDGYWVRVDEH